MAIVPLIFLSIGRERSAEKQWAFLMAGSECAGLDVSESAPGSQSRACWRVLFPGGLAAQWDSQHLHIFWSSACCRHAKGKKILFCQSQATLTDLTGLFATHDPLTEVFLQLIMAHGQFERYTFKHFSFLFFELNEESEIFLEEKCKLVEELVSFVELQGRFS